MKTDLEPWKINLESWKTMKTDLEPLKTNLEPWKTMKTDFNHKKPTWNHEKPWKPTWNHENTTWKLKNLIWDYWAKWSFFVTNRQTNRQNLAIIYRSSSSSQQSRGSSLNLSWCTDYCLNFNHYNNIISSS